MLSKRFLSLGAALVFAGVHSALGRPLALAGAFNASICVYSV